MKITHNKVGQNLNLTDTSRMTKSEAHKSSGTQSTKNSTIDKLNSNLAQSLGSVTPQTSNSVKVDLSSRAQDIQRAKEIAMSSPDVDQAKVEKFQKLIDAGQYKIDSKAIAERMVDEHLMASSKSSNE